jgi:hypothetical protein
VGRHGGDSASVFPADDDDDDEHPFFMRIAGPFSVIHYIHTKREEISQQWFSPVALFVCQESRRHTLRHYRLIQHAVFEAGSFYSDPSVDVLWFDYEFTGHDVNDLPQSQERMDMLSQCYGTQLDLFKNVLVEEMFWDPERGNQEYLGFLLGLEIILLMDTSRQDICTPVELDPEDLQNCIVVGKKEYSKFNERHPTWPLKSIRYLDRNSNFIEYMWGASMVSRRHPVAFF